MPNHCVSKITIQGPHDVLTKFFEGIKEFPSEGKSLMQSYLPCDEVDEIDIRMINWGSKWGDYDGEYELLDDCITGFHYSAWEPCLNGFEGLSNIFPDLHFKVEYHETGNAFRGIFLAEKGMTGNNRWDMTQEDYNELGYENFEDDDEDAIPR